MMGLLQFFGLAKRKSRDDGEVIEEQVRRKRERTTLVKAERILNDEQPYEAKVQAALDKMDEDKAEVKESFTTTISELDKELQELLREDMEGERRPREAAG